MEGLDFIENVGGPERMATALFSYNIHGMVLPYLKLYGDTSTSRSLKRDK